MAVAGPLVDRAFDAEKTFRTGGVEIVVAGQIAAGADFVGPKLQIFDHGLVVMLGVDVDEIELSGCERRGGFGRGLAMQRASRGEAGGAALRFSEASVVFLLLDIVDGDVSRIGGKVSPGIDAMQ